MRIFLCAIFLPTMLIVYPAYGQKADNSQGAIHTMSLGNDSIANVILADNLDQNNSMQRNSTIESILEFGFSPEFNSSDYTYYKIKMVISYHNRPEYALGFAINSKICSRGYPGSSSLPTLAAMADLRVYPFKTEINPFFVLDLGYSVGMSGALLLGPEFNGGVGFRYWFNPKVAMSLAVTYELQFAKIEYFNYYYGMYTQNIQTDGIGFTLGIVI